MMFPKLFKFDLKNYCSFLKKVQIAPPNTSTLLIFHHQTRVANLYTFFDNVMGTIGRFHNMISTECKTFHVNV